MIDISGLRVRWFDGWNVQVRIFVAASCWRLMYKPLHAIARIQQVHVHETENDGGNTIGIFAFAEL